MLTSNLVNRESPEVQELIQNHEKVSEDLPMKMPPKREIEHTIEVKLGSNPVIIKPYRYPHHQKTKSERLVQDILKCDIITKSRIP